MLFIVVPTHREPQRKKMARLTSIALMYPEAHVIHSDDFWGKGKGRAIRKGILRALGFSKSPRDFLCYIDGDGDIPITQIQELYDHRNDADVIVGKKKYDTLFMRRLISLLSRIYIYILFRIPVNTQTGVKLFRLHHMPPYSTDGFGFDIEVLAIMQKQGRTFLEVPVDATINKHVKPMAIIYTFIESIRIFFLLS